MSVFIKSLLVFSTDTEKCFFTEFHEKFNIIKGKNTSGKSTLIQSIIYAFGINDGKEKLNELLQNKLIFRLDLLFNEDEITLIRDNSSFYTFISGKNGVRKIKRFDGINADNSNEHVKLKEYISEIFNFNLYLESKGNLVKSPLEVMWLPSYISQAVGWVYLRESFSNLNYYKDFKTDYIDYHLGILKGNERVELNRLQLDKAKNEKEIVFLNNMGENNNEIVVTKLIEEKYISKSNDYLKGYEELCEELVENESKYIELCNLKSLEVERKKILSKIKSNIKKQKPEHDLCPVCIQVLPNSLEDLYAYSQKVNNTNEELVVINEKINQTQSLINSLSKKIKRITDSISIRYNNLLDHIHDERDYSFNEWVDNKVNIKFLDTVERKISDKVIKNEMIDLKLKKFLSDDETWNIRTKKENIFYKIFHRNLNELKVKLPNEKRYTRLYSINSFPFQGVELHKTVMAYHFAFNELISETKELTIFPFLLDAIMKEDIDEENRKLIFNFISKYSPKSKQIFFSVSEALKDRVNNNSRNIQFMQQLYFPNNSKIIQIGDGDSERTFLRKTNAENIFRIDETLTLMNEV
ncbi:hypothetical protein BFR85_011425 [Acinetobacter pittii]|uniref:hypothetical protein n=1 Tax=Acinetobacter pittii TaxID=48296 RepID=UPI0009C15A88|nr:hypothetical protein [Acinetobacter pittii]MCK0913656.1 hypothetical protein [Acinetobacter pittii]